MRACQTLSVTTPLPEGPWYKGCSLLTAGSLALLDASTCLGPAQPLSAPILSGSPDPAWARPSVLSPWCLPTLGWCPRRCSGLPPFPGHRGLAWNQLSEYFSIPFWTLSSSKRTQSFIMIFFFWPYHRTAWMILVCWPGIEPRHPAVEAWIPNLWTARGVSKGTQSWFMILGLLAPIAQDPAWEMSSTQLVSWALPNLFHGLSGLWSQVPWKRLVRIGRNTPSRI